MTFTTYLRPLALSLAVLAVAGCGGNDHDNGNNNTPVGGGGGTGGNGGGDATVNPVPASALASSDAFIAYVRQIVAGSSDTGEPVPFGGSVNGPTNDTAEPAAL